MTAKTFVAYASDDSNFVFFNEKDEILFEGTKGQITKNYNLDMETTGYYAENSTIYICVKGEWYSNARETI